MVTDKDQRWLAEIFEFENCAECGQGQTGHVVGPDPLGLPHAWCQHYHVQRHDEDNDLYATYNLGYAMSYASEVLRQLAESEHDMISACGEIGQFENAYNAWQRCERWHNLADNAENIHKQYSLPASERAPLYQSDDPETLAKRRLHADHTIDNINLDGPFAFRIWACVNAECAPTDDGTDE